jgi:hypothetical protein
MAIQEEYNAQDFGSHFKKQFRVFEQLFDQASYSPNVIRLQVKLALELDRTESKFSLL